MMMMMMMGGGGISFHPSVFFFGLNSLGPNFLAPMPYASCRISLDLTASSMGEREK